MLVYQHWRGLFSLLYHWLQAYCLSFTAHVRLFSLLYHWLQAYCLSFTAHVRTVKEGVALCKNGCVPPQRMPALDTCDPNRVLLLRMKKTSFKNGQWTEHVKIGHVKTDRFRGHFRGHFHGHPRGTFRGAFRGECSRRAETGKRTVVGTLVGTLVGALVGPLVGVLVQGKSKYLPPP